MRGIISHVVRRIRQPRTKAKSPFASLPFREDGSRAYSSKADYFAHQRSKRGQISAKLAAERPKRLENFVARFASIPEIPPRCSILCLGARNGEEVEAFIRHGHFAVGVDLEPGPESRFVVSGDFENLQFANASIDCVYSNSLDHAFSIEAIAKEMSRILKPGGLAVLDIVQGQTEGFKPGEFEAQVWSNAEALAKRVAECGQFEISRFSGVPNAPRWHQAVLAAPIHD